MSRNLRGLTWRPLVPGSDQHLSLMALAKRAQNEKLGHLLYPAHWQREDSRRASAVMAAAARRQAEKQNAPDNESEAFTAPRSTVDGLEDGCSSDSA
jgi:hypothetical protein